MSLSACPQTIGQTVCPFRWSLTLSRSTDIRTTTRQTRTRAKTLARRRISVPPPTCSHNRRTAEQRHAEQKAGTARRVGRQQRRGWAEVLTARADHERDGPQTGPWLTTAAAVLRMYRPQLHHYIHSRPTLKSTPQCRSS